MRWFRKPSKTKKVIIDDSPYERCINCGEKLDILKTTPIGEREHYIIGSGQLCQKCFYSAYVEKDDCVPFNDEKLLNSLRHPKR